MMTKRTILITGATKGIGYATSVRLSKQGHNVVGIARNPIDNFPGDLFTADLADAKNTHQTFIKINETYDVSGIVNNVGIAIRETISEITLSNLHTVLDLNLRPALDAMQVFMNGMIQRKFGRIVNIASRAVLGVANASSYAAAKAGLIAFTKSWGYELAKSGITVNAVAPGPTATDRFRQMRPVGSEAETRTLQDIPMGRFAEPDEIAAAIAFLLSEDAGFITGHTLFIDGGASIGRSMI